MNSQTQLVEKQNKEKLIENVQKWVLIEGKLKEVNEKTKKMREMKSQLGKDICGYMTENNLNNHIEISDGELRFFEKKEYTPLSFGYIEKRLHEIIADDEQVNFIIKYLKEKRETNVSLDIKRHYNK
jgi:lauroyl/myristoyl acyltransferase